ncbi:hypothetical protein CANARDRAFT_176555 [[Candida] arabinofermentans NRRL YB-2248]|uniref:Uncharacterized protein n=1 Tax=[Candida] arabinofermentans NRRL YB-2248 TaxID=983967 RepID=A0A1E4SYZ4_9ASCO|nr:hypothetical protein CANARDRAFT_176555 [[Candida] arabinofermentans NRRL YB-2248]
MYQCNTLTHLIYINILKKDWLFVYRAFCLLCKSRLFDDRSTWGIGIECLKNLNELEFIEILKNSTKLSELELKTLIDIPYFSMSKNPVLASIGYKCDKIPFQLIKNAILSKDRIYHVKFFKYLNYMHSNYLPLILLPRFNYPHQFVDDLLNVPEHEQVENKNGDSNSTSDSESSDSDHDINNDIDNAIEEEELLKALKRRGRFPKYLAPLFALSSRTHVPAYTQTLLWNYIISGQFLQFKDMISSLILTRPYSYDPMIQYMVGLNTYMEVLYIYTKLKSSDDGMTDEIELDKALKSVDVCKDEFKKVLELDSELIDLKDVLNQVDKLKERIIDLKSMDVNGRTRKKRKVESASASATSSEDSDSDSDSDSDTSHESS